MTVSAFWPNMTLLTVDMCDCQCSSTSAALPFR